MTQKSKMKRNVKIFLPNRYFFKDCIYFWYKLKLEFINSLVIEAMITLNHSVTESAFDRLCEFREDNNLLFETNNVVIRDTQIVAKRVTLEIGYALLAIVGAIEAIFRLALAATLSIGSHFLENRVVHQMLQDTIEGLISAMHATAYSILALFVNFFGDDHLELRVEVQRAVHMVGQISGHVMRSYFR